MQLYGHDVVLTNKAGCSAFEEFSSLDRKWISSYNLVPAMTECQAQKGEVDKAVAMAELEAKGNKQAELWLHVGHLDEVYKTDNAKAVTAYETALKLASQNDMKEWIQTKLNYLKNQHQVCGLSNQHVSSKDSDGGQ